MVLDYWRAARPELALPRADPDALYRALYSPEDQGIPAAALIRHLDQIGFNALPLNATRADIEDQLARGRPLIAALKDGSRLHYVVVRGIEPDAVWINDPWDGKPHRLPWRSFDQRWKGGARWLLLAVPQSSSSR
jgi:ABC-type bacteriocin/lantibiotic exporter with double-glycine peptidase domain